MKKPLKYVSPSEAQNICLKHPGCVGCPLKLERNRCAYYSIKRGIKLSEEEYEKEVELWLQ